MLVRHIVEKCPDNLSKIIDATGQRSGCTGSIEALKVAFGFEKRWVFRVLTMGKRPDDLSRVVDGCRERTACPRRLDGRSVAHHPRIGRHDSLAARRIRHFGDS